MHRDSVELAKERMRATKGGTSIAGRLHRPISRPELGPPRYSDEAVVTQFSFAKAHAIDALKRGPPAPILRSSASDDRHIRIET